MLGKIFTFKIATLEIKLQHCAPTPTILVSIFPLPQKCIRPKNQVGFLGEIVGGRLTDGSNFARLCCCSAFDISRFHGLFKPDL